MTKTWLITGAGRGMGVEFARAALAAGHNVVATGRNPDTVRSAVGEHENLLVTALDVTDPHSAEDAAAAAVERFGRIDVLVNNAGSFLAGFFEELTTEQVRCADRDQPVRPDDGDPGGAAGDAQAALRPGDLDLLGRRRDRQPLRLGLRGVEVRPGGLDGVPDRRGASRSGSAR